MLVPTAVTFSRLLSFWLPNALSLAGKASFGQPV